jgi:glycine/D-amino acid oxidase-like deaminating enzyme
VTLSRRAFVSLLGAGAVAASAPALVRLSRKGGRPLAGGFADGGAAVGHRLRDGGAWPAPRQETRVPVVIVGGGIAGLSAGWRLDRAGFRDFVLLEMAGAAGGNARWGENEVSRYPWAAHYLPVPGPDAVHVRELCEDLGLLTDGAWDERHLCHGPQERLFQHGDWRGAVEPTDALGAAGHAEFARFGALVREARESGGFRIPMALGRVDPALDRRSFADWLDAHGLRSPELRWYLEYGCRDDYGASLASTSAWAGLHYFASRPETEEGPLTWPEGNGWIVERLATRLGERVRTASPAYRIARAERATEWEVLTPQVRYRADAVIVATPLMVLPHVLEGCPPLEGAEVSPWLVANLTLDRWPHESGRGAPPAWDNVIYRSPSLGYVVATHQSLRTTLAPTVWTWYHALSDEPPAAARRRLRDTDWRTWTEFILADLERAHPDVRECVSRIDVARHAHAMIRPTPGWLTSESRAAFLRDRSRERLFLAHSDLSGLSLFEEAQYRGVVAADGAMRVVGGGAA